MAKKGPRKKLPKELAVINADNCTGCESCLEVCPVDCIDLISISRGLLKGNETWCEIDLERCVGCEVCVHIPQKKTNPYELLVCPWDAIAGWAEKLSFWKKTDDGLSLGLKWPRVVRNISIATILFIGPRLWGRYGCDLTTDFYRKAIRETKQPP